MNGRKLDIDDNEDSDDKSFRKKMAKMIVRDEEKVRKRLIDI